MKTTRLLSFVIGFALVVAACGGDDAESDNTNAGDVETTAASPTTTATPDTTVAEPSGDAPELAGTSWVLVFYNLPDGSLTNPWPGSEITAKFDDAGTISGSTGCNEYSADFSVSGPYDEFEDGVRDENDGQAVSISLTGVTERACEEQNWMEQEGEFLDNLAGTTHWFVARETLRLRSDTTYLEFEPAG